MREGFSSALAGGQGDNLYDTWLNSPRYSGDPFDDGQPIATGSGRDIPYTGMGMTHMGMGMSRFGVSMHPVDMHPVDMHPMDTRPDTRPMDMGHVGHMGRDVGYPGMGMGMDTGQLPQWDPAEELACLLRASMPDEASADVCVPDEPVVTSTAPQPVVGVDHTCTRPPARPPYPVGHRRVRQRPPVASLLRTASFSIGALSAVIVAMVSVFGGIVAYAPLREAAIDYELSAGVVRWWPLLVYGPWMVASLSILRAALHRRAAVHSWCVVMFFCFVAVFLCVAQAPRTVTGMAAACVPPLAALTCFHQLVRQLTLTRPPRQTAPRHRQGTPRHRQTATSPARRREEPAPSRPETVTAQGCSAHPNSVVTGLLSGSLSRHHAAPGGLGGRGTGLRVQ